MESVPLVQLPPRETDETFQNAMAWNATAHRQRRTWASHLYAQSVLLEKVTSLATDTAVVGVRVFPDVIRWSV